MMGSDTFSTVLSLWMQQQKEAVPPGETDLAFACYDESKKVLHQGFLRVEGIPLGVEGLATLQEMLRVHGKNTRIQHLHIIRCGLGPPQNHHHEEEEEEEEEFAANMRGLQSLLLSTPNLQSIDLSTNNLDNRALEQVLPMLSNHPTLERVSLEENRVQGHEGGVLIRNFLMQSPKIVSLNLSENPIGWDGALVLAEAFARHGRLQHVNIASCGIVQRRPTPNMPREAPERRCIFQILTESFLRNPHLRELQWSVGEIGLDFDNTLDIAEDHYGTLAVARLLERHPQLQDLAVIQSPRFWSPELPPAANTRLANALRTSRTLQNLTLEGCGICDDTVGMLCQVLLHNPNIQHLDLLSNDLGDEGHEHVHQVLPQLKHLRTLSLEGSTIETPHDFVKAMYHNTSLTCVRVLDTPGTDITTDVDRLTTRNEYMMHAKSMLRNETVSDALWAPALAKFAQFPVSSSSIYQVLREKLWTPSIEAVTPPLRKRPRLA